MMNARPLMLPHLGDLIAPVPIEHAEKGKVFCATWRQVAAMVTCFHAGFAWCPASLHACYFCARTCQQSAAVVRSLLWVLESGALGLLKARTP